MRGKLTGAINIDTNKTLLTIAVNARCNEFEKFKGMLIDFYIDQHREKRSNSANGLLWALCDQIAALIDISKEAVYIDAVKHAGKSIDLGGLTQEEANDLKEAWGVHGTAWLAELVDYEPDAEHLVMRLYYGSSVYNKKEMSRLLNYVVAEAEDMGINTDPDRVRSLLNDWDKVKGE